MTHSAENDAPLIAEAQAFIAWAGADSWGGQVVADLLARIADCEARVWDETLLVAGEEVDAAADAQNEKIAAIAGNSHRPSTFDTSTAYGMRRVLPVLAEMRERGYPTRVTSPGSDSTHPPG